MATSGSYGMSGGGYSTTFNWWLNGQDIGANKSNIGWNWIADWAGSTWVKSSQAALWIDGAEVFRNGYNTGRKMYGGQQAGGSRDIYHNADGTRSFGANGEAAFYQYGLNAWGGGGWDLPTIPRHAYITGASGDINDEQNPWVSYTNPAYTGIDVYLEILDRLYPVPGSNVGLGNPYSGTYGWSLSNDSRNAIRKAMADTNTARIRVVLHDGINGGNWDVRDANINIINANPTFSGFTYKDTNAKTVAITGDDQVIINGYSNLVATVAKAASSAKKYASMKQYVATIAGESQTKNYSDSAAVTFDFGTINNSGNSLSITARDSRGNTATVTKQVKTVTYSKPVVIARGTRKNNFEAETTIHIEGSVSTLQVNGKNKNAVDATSGVKYRYREQGTSAWGAWTNVASSMGNNGVIGTTDFVLSLNNSKAYEFQAQITDKLATTTVSFTVGVGIPIMRIGTKDNLIYNNEQPLMPSHVGQIIMSTTLDTAAKVKAIYGGTWEAYAKGRTLVGFDSSQSEFNASGKTGGVKTVTLDVNQIPSHAHSYDVMWTKAPSGNQLAWGGGGTSLDYKNGVNTGSTGGNQAHSNLQPYQTIYIWRRTA